VTCYVEVAYSVRRVMARALSSNGHSVLTSGYIRLNRSIWIRIRWMY